MKPVFISYSSKDRDFVEHLRADLQANGVNVWIDQTGLKAGTRNWEHDLREALRDARALVLVATPSSRRSNYVQGELEIAEMYKCPVYPLWAAGEEWPDCIPLGLIKMQYINARGDAYRTAIPELVEALGQVPNVEKSTGPVPKVAPDFEPRNPYKGLRAFREGDAGDFFGRETLIEELVEALCERMDGDRLLAVIGPSGSGKSSVVMAGLLPRLRDGTLPGSANWVYLDPIVPGAHPPESLTATLANALPEKSNTVIRQDLDDPEGRGLHLLGRQIVRGTDRRLVLFIDQFEELFTQTVDEDERRQFITLLTTAVSEPHGPVTAILTLRADFYDRPIEYPALVDLLKTHQIVPPMSLDELRGVIEKPAALPDVQITFEGGLVGDLLFEVREQVGGLPLLQFTLDQLFEQRDNHRLTLDAYQEIGGLSGALARHAEATYEGLPTDEHRRLVRTLFLRLIEPGAIEQDTTRRRANMSELEIFDTKQMQVLREVTDAFVKARLLTTDEVAGKATIEVSHEALIREWERLGTWLDEARDDIIIQKNVSEDAAAWIDRGCKLDDDGLYRGMVLENALAWALQNAPSTDETAFIEASMALGRRRAEEDLRRRHREADTAQQAKQYARRAKQFRRWAIVLAIVFVLSVGAAVALVLTASDAQTQANAAQTAQAGAEAALEKLSGVQLTPIAMMTYLPAEARWSMLPDWQPIIQDFDGVEMVYVPAGCFMMGSISGDHDELPVHEVCFDDPFWIDRFEVTKRQFERLGGEAEYECFWSRPDQPRTDVTWFEAQTFCEQRGARLPTEAEWEYVARGPDNLVYPWGNEFIKDNVVHWYTNSEEAKDVGGDHRPGGRSWVGSYDMSGNVWEWVADWYSRNYYDTLEEIVTISPQGPDSGDERVLRGGAFDVAIDGELSGANRNSFEPGRGSIDFGFRCARPFNP